MINGRVFCVTLEEETSKVDQDKYRGWHRDNILYDTNL